MSTRDLAILSVGFGALALWLMLRPTAANPAATATPSGVQNMAPEPAGAVFMGGSPSFDEKTGSYLPQRLLAFGPSVVQAPGSASPMLY